MRKMLIVVLILLVSLCFIYGCGKKDVQQETDKVPVEVKQAEMADSTAMDSAIWDSTAVDTMAADQDSM
ncbi:MAG: hypothetical protein KAW61_02945 [candidate division Zixibacteria bacterium]|nr:hypothetical protein [candidate division Zixibacteria bacterium]